MQTYHSLNFYLREWRTFMFVPEGISCTQFILFIFLPSSTNTFSPRYCDPKHSLGQFILFILFLAPPIPSPPGIVTLNILQVSLYSLSFYFSPRYSDPRHSLGQFILVILLAPPIPSPPGNILQVRLYSLSFSQLHQYLLLAPPIPSPLGIVTLNILQVS